MSVELGPSFSLCANGLAGSVRMIRFRLMAVFSFAETFACDSSAIVFAISI
jgi:hypothetical protein